MLRAMDVRNGAAKLNEDQVRKIRRLGKDGFNAREIAAEFKMSKEAIARILRRETWAWLDDDPGVEMELMPNRTDQMLNALEKMNPKKIQPGEAAASEARLRAMVEQGGGKIKVVGEEGEEIEQAPLLSEEEEAEFLANNPFAKRKEK